MILMYHKVDLGSPTYMWVSTNAFRKQMENLRAYEVVLLDDYDPTNPRHVAITFDDVYDGVIKYAVPIMAEYGYPFELFVCSEWIGRDNSGFGRLKEPYARFATLDDLDHAVRLGGRLQWHTSSHPFLPDLSPDELARELDVPEALQERFGPEHFKWFAYPYGGQNEAVVEATRSRFSGALSCNSGNNSDHHQLNRITVLERTGFTASAILADKIRAMLQPLRRPVARVLRLIGVLPPRPQSEPPDRAITRPK